MSLLKLLLRIHFLLHPRLHCKSQLKLVQDFGKSKSLPDWAKTLCSSVLKPAWRRFLITRQWSKSSVLLLLLTPQWTSSIRKLMSELTTTQLSLLSQTSLNLLLKHIKRIPRHFLKKSSFSDKVLERVKSCNPFNLKSTQSRKDSILIRKDTNHVSLSSKWIRKLARNSILRTHKSKVFKTQFLVLLLLMVLLERTSSSISAPRIATVVYALLLNTPAYTMTPNWARAVSGSSPTSNATTTTTGKAPFESLLLWCMQESWPNSLLMS